MSGAVRYDVPVGGYQGTISTTGTDMVNGNSQYHGATSLHWDVTPGGSAGLVSATSMVSVSANALWNVTGDLEYGNDKYSFNASDSTAEFVCWGDGTYGGNWNTW